MLKHESGSRVTDMFLPLETCAQAFSNAQLYCRVGIACYPPLFALLQIGRPSAAGQCAGRLYLFANSSNSMNKPNADKGVVSCRSKCRHRLSRVCFVV